jgi:hypothetical protein
MRHRLGRWSGQTPRFQRTARERKRGVMHHSNKERLIAQLNCPGPPACARALMVAGIAMALVSWAVPASAQTYESYGVFCANGRIEIDARSEEQMRSNRGACQFGRFPNRSDAEGFARRNFRGVGGSCSCR